MLEIVLWNLVFVALLFLSALFLSWMLSGNWLIRILGLVGVLVLINLMAWSMSPGGTAWLKQYAAIDSARKQDGTTGGGE